MVEEKTMINVGQVNDACVCASNERGVRRRSVTEGTHLYAGEHKGPSENSRLQDLTTPDV